MDLEKKIIQELFGDRARKNVEKITRGIPCKQTEGVASWKGNSEVHLANRVQVKLSRVLRPIDFSVANRYGFDDYGLTALSTPIPFLYETRNLASLSPRSTGYHALITHMVQQATRVSDGLREASELTETALEDSRRI